MSFVDRNIRPLNPLMDNMIMPRGGQIRCTGSLHPAHRVPPRQEVNTLVFTLRCHKGGILLIIITDEVVLVVVIP